MLFVAKGTSVTIPFFATDPSNNAQLIDIVDSGDAYCWKLGNVASAAVITGGVTLTKVSGTGAPTAGMYVVTVDTSNAAYDEEDVYFVCVEGDVVAGGTTGVTGAVIGLFTLIDLMGPTEVKAAAEDAIESRGLVLTSEISSVPSQTAIRITSGSTVDDMYNGMSVIFRDSGGLFIGQRFIKDYTGSTKELTINRAAPVTITTSHTADIVQTDFASVVDTTRA